MRTLDLRSYKSRGLNLLSARLLRYFAGMVWTYVVLSFCRVGTVLCNELVVLFFPFTGPRILDEAKSVYSVLVELIVAVVNVLLSASRVLVSREEMNVRLIVEINSFEFFVTTDFGTEDDS